MNLDHLLTSGNSIVAELARRAVRHRQDLDAERIGPAEYDSLCRQLLALHGIDEAAMEAEERKQIQEAVAILRAFLGVLL